MNSLSEALPTRITLPRVPAGTAADAARTTTRGFSPDATSDRSAATSPSVSLGGVAVDFFLGGTALIVGAYVTLGHVASYRSEDEAGVGVGPHPLPWPDDPRLDPELLAGGDRRNVVDRYRYWSREAVVADLDQRRHPFHVAVENWQHDLNIGTVVRNANAFLAAEVHIVGARRWNKRGAMVTDRYQHVRHHPTLEDFRAWAVAENLPVLGVDLLPGSRSLVDADIPRACVLLFGQEGPGLSDDAHAIVEQVLHIPQWGSTRSLNAGVASGIAMYEWCRRHAQ
jgi:tRNA(Leu) C34 or U34 (ribose-2'-O)-methylase TrmL